MKNYLKKISTFTAFIFIICATFGNSSITASAVTASAAALKAREAKALLSSASVIQANAMKNAAAASSRAYWAGKAVGTVTTLAAVNLTANYKLLTAKAIADTTAALQAAKLAKKHADAALAKAVNSYKLASKAKSAADRLVRYRSSSSERAYNTASKAAKAEATKAASAVKTGKTALDKALEASSTAKQSASNVTLEMQSVEKAAADKVAAQKAAEQAAADKAAADKAAAEKAAADKAAADKVAADKAAADKAAADKAAEKVVAGTLSIAAAGGNTTMLLGSTLQITPSFLPVNTTEKTITWSIIPGTGAATISATGLLNATAVGTVTVLALYTATGLNAYLPISIGTAAPAIAGHVVDPGSVLGSTKITYTAASGNSLRTIRQANAFTQQYAGLNVASNAIPYTSGTDLLGTTFGEHIGLFEVDASGKIVKFVEIVVSYDKIAVNAPIIYGYTVDIGSVAGSSKITYTPTAGNSLRYVKQTGVFTIPMVGTNASTIGTAYTSGADIPTTSTGLHIGLYEVNATSQVVKFVDITLVAENIATTAPSISGHVVGAGTLAGATRITYTPAVGNSLRVAKQTSALSTPFVGTNASAIGTAYTSGSNITDAAATQHIGLYEVDYYNKVVKFVDITLIANNIAIAATTPIITGYLIEPGSVPGSTKITYTPDPGNMLRYAKQPTAYAIPVVGSPAVGISYTSGANIINVASGEHIGLYEVDAASQVAKFVDITLGAGNIAITPPAPPITDYTIEQGSVTGSTKITYTAGTGNSLKYVKQATAFTTPLTGLNAASIGTNYQSGNDITGALANDHIGLYEINGSLLVVKFVDITLGSGNIKSAPPAPAITGYIVEQGTVSGSTKITYTPATGNSLRYIKQSVAFATPLTETDASAIGSPYTSGTNILGAITAEHIGLYEVDASKKIVKFVDISLSAANIASFDYAPAITGHTVTKGTVANSTKFTYIVDINNSLRYVLQSAVFAKPLVNEAASAVGTAYVSGNNITGAAAGQHLGVYEINSSGFVVKFVDISLTSAQVAVAAPVISGAVIAQGAVVGAVKITYTPVGNTLRSFKQGAAFTVPLEGSSAAGIGSVYTSGNDITGVVAGEHIGLFEVDGSNNVVKFIDIIVQPADIAVVAPVITGYTIAAGSVAGSTKLTYATATGNTLKLEISDTIIATPLLGADASLIADYTSNTDIAGVAIDKYLGLYEVDGSNKVVNFICIKLVQANIK